MISFAEFMSDSTAEDRQQYLVGVMEMAEQACTRSDEILCTFRQVRQELFRLVEEARDEMDNSVNAFNHDDLHLVDTLRAAIDALEAFSSEISAFVQWWDWLKIESNSWRTGTRTVLFNLESLREPAVIEQWHVVRYQFTEYTNMVRLMEDTFPHLFSPPTHWQGDNAVGHQEEINITRPELTSILGGAVAFEEASIRELPGSPGPPSIAQTLASFLPSSEPRIPGAFLEGYENLLSNWYITLPVVCALLYLVSHAPLHP
ncbi:hypothetical protein B0H34DRAFT_67060 [Crassisporium funariophilum]|nr:hypothetical protein B0H34DRAFT_67060 [Crassisporium funariophilum]